MVNHLCFPTILIAELDQALSQRLVTNLNRIGYIVLEAHDAAEALAVAKIHSRPIHLMLTDGRSRGQNLAAALKPYRPQMGVLFVSSDSNPDLTLDRVQQVLQASGRAAAAG